MILLYYLITYIMRKIVILSLFTLFLTSCWTNSYQKSDNTSSTEDKQIVKTIEQKEEIENIQNEEIDKNEIKEVVTTTTKWVYTDYSEDLVKNAKWKIVLFFHADWCPTCIATEKDILEKWVPDWLNIFNTDFDNEIKLKEKYGVLTQTTFVQVDNNGNMIKKWVWGKLDDIVESVK